MSDLSESDALRVDPTIPALNDTQKLILVNLVKAQQAFISKYERQPTHVLLSRGVYYELVDHLRFANPLGGLRFIYGMCPILSQDVNEVLPCLL